jgi:dipeptidyl aminopeptidase/acylaminoacyl peptidase
VPVLKKCTHWLSAVLQLAVLTTVVRPQVKHKPTLDDLLTLKNITGLSLSPDGKSLAYMDYENDVWVRPIDPEGQPKNLGKGSLPTWSPDGKLLAYYSNSMQLWLLNTQTQKVERITDIPGGITPDPLTMIIGWRGYFYDSIRLSWSPDNQKIVLAWQTPMPGVAREASAPAQNRAETPLVLTLETPPEWTLDGVFRGTGFRPPRWINGTFGYNYPENDHSSVSKQVSQIFVVDVNNKKIEQLTHDAGEYFTPEWSPDSSQIVCVSTEGRALLGEGSGPTNLYLIDVRSGKKQALTSDVGYKRMPHWSPDGKWIAYFTAQTLNHQFVSIIPPSGGTPIPLAFNMDRDIQEINWFPDSKSIIMTYVDGISWPIVRVMVPTGELLPVSGAEPARRFYTTVSRSGTIAWTESNGFAYGLVRTKQAGESSSRVLWDPNPQISTWNLGVQEVVHWENSRGDQLDGVLIKPQGYREGRRYPLIVDCYPAKPNEFKGDPMWGNQAWAAQGYAIFYPAPRAPHVWMNPFRSTSFTSEGKGPEGLKVMADDILSGVDELIRKGIVDPDRMALYGFSNGGGVVNQMVTLTSRFKCAVSVAGATSADWPRRFFLHTLEPWTAKLADMTPWDDPQAFIQLSAVYRLNHVTTPMLLADGDEDDDFLLNMIEMYNGLRWLGRDVTFIRYPGQGHGFDGWALKDFWQREAAFFAEYLKPDVQ